jgi:hypothetical protein
MPLRPPAGAEIRDLVRALDRDDLVTRESAVARLTLVAPRSVDALLRAYASASPRAQTGILRALEPVASPRTLTMAREALDVGETDVQLAAIAVLRALAVSRQPTASRDALDALVAAAFDDKRPGSVRDAARDAAELPQPGQTGAAPATEDDVWAAALEGPLPGSADALKSAVDARRGTARLTDLQRLVDRVRAGERKEDDLARREQWRVVRGALHQALAARNSRLALYDLRDSLLESERLPVAFLAAIEEIGDASCVETLAAAYDASSRSADTWWREHLASAFRAIVQREGLTRRHAAIKRALARWPDATADLLSR